MASKGMKAIAVAVYVVVWALVLLPGRRERFTGRTRGPSSFHFLENTLDGNETSTR